MIHARIEKNIVVELIDDQGGDINEMFTPEIVATLVPDDGTAVIGATWDGTSFTAPAPETIPLTDTQTLLKNRVDSEAENTRLKFITGGSGQALIYERKRAEAENWLAATSPVASDYPLIKARAERLNPTIPDYAAVATEWKTQADTWMVVAAAIEDIREGAKEAIDAATTAADALTAASNLTWPTPV